jgi:hypothetical protein
MSEWQRLLTRGLLQVSPRAGLESLLSQPTSNPVAVLGWLLGEVHQAPPAPSHPHVRPAPPASTLANPDVTRFNLLEVDEE